MKFSIVVPIYNVESYLSECLDSILNQTFQNYEIICINDASTDKSYEILLKYAEKNKQIKVINNSSNKGLSYSRNCGIKEAVGEYILFVDSDDMLCRDSLDVLDSIIKKEEVEMVCYEYLVKLEGKVAKEKNITSHGYEALDGKVKAGQEFFIEMAKNKYFVVSAWQYLISREFLLNNNLWFYEGIVHEDILFMFQCVLKATKIRYINEKIYTYRGRDNSITSTINEYRLDSLIIVLGKIWMLWHTCQLIEGMDNAIRQYIDIWIPAINKMYALFPEHKKMQIGSSADQFLFDMLKGDIKSQYRYVLLDDIEIEYIKKFDNVLIYGAGSVATELIVYLRKCDINIKAVVVSDKSLNLSKIEGITIFQIEELLNIREKALVIIGVLKRKQEAIWDKLKELGFRNVMAIDTDRIIR